jgi:hypothetical protein
MELLPLAEDARILRGEGGGGKRLLPRVPPRRQPASGGGGGEPRGSGETCFGGVRAGVARRFDAGGWGRPGGRGGREGNEKRSPLQWGADHWQAS